MLMDGHAFSELLEVGALLNEVGVEVKAGLE